MIISKKSIKFKIGTIENEDIIEEPGVDFHNNNY